jgi:hypothetical protein
MKVTVRSVFDCPPEFVWDRVQTSSCFREIIWPVMRVEPVAGTSIPERWLDGKSIPLRMYLFGFLPLGRHTIHHAAVDPHARQIRSRESGTLVRKWWHDITVADAGDGRTLYSDEVEIACGPLTLPVAAFAWLFYRHRQRRWKKVIRKANPAAVAAA